MLFLYSFLLLLALIFLFFYFNPRSLLNLVSALTKKQAGFVQKETSVNNMKCVYFDNEKTELPALVLIHGVTADKEVWAQLSPLLSKHYHLIVPDLPAHGDSEKLTNKTYTPEIVIDFVHGLLSQLNITQYFVAGNSMGGGVAGLLSASYPEEVQGLALLNTAGIDSSTRTPVFESILKGSDHNTMLPTSTKEFESVFKSIFFKPPFAPGFVKKELARDMILRRNDFKKFFDDTIQDPTTDAFILETVLDKLNMPILIIWGTHDNIMHVSSVDILRERLPHAQVAVFNECGHVPQMEKPQETFDTMHEFYSKIK